MASPGGPEGLNPVPGLGSDGIAAVARTLESLREVPVDRRVQRAERLGEPPPRRVAMDLWTQLTALRSRQARQRRGSPRQP